MGQIAELWVEIGARLENFNKGMSDAEKAMVKIGQKFEDVGKKTAIAGAAITGAFLGVVYKTVDMGDKFNDLAQQTGISANVLSSLKLAADKSGASIEGIARGMKFLAEEMIKTSTAGDKSKTILGALGIAATDGSGKLRNMNDVLFDVADKFKGMEDGALKNRLAVELFGKAGMELIPMLNMGRKGLEENVEAAKKLGIVFTTEAARAADKFNDALVELKAAGAGLGKTIAETLMPPLKKAIESMAEAIAKVRAWADAHPQLTKFLSATALAIGGLTTGMGSALIVIGGIMKLIPTLSIVFAALSGPIGIVIAALAGLIAIGILVYKNWDEIKEKLVAIWAYIKAVAVAVWKTIWDAVGPIISVIVKGIVTAFTVLWDTLKNIAIAIANVVIGPFNWLKEKAIDIFKAVAEFVIDKLIWLMEQIGNIPIIKKFVKNLEEGLAAAKASLAESSAKMKESSEKMAEGFEGATKAAKGQEDELKKLMDALDKTGTATKNLAEEMGIALKIDLEKKYEKLKQALEKYSKQGQLTKDEEKKLKQALEETGIALGKLEPKLKNLGLLTEDAAEATGIYALALKALREPAKNAEQTFQDLVDEISNFKIGIEKAGETSEKITKNMSDYFAGLYNDIAMGWANTIQQWMEGATTFKDFIKGIWEDIKSSFFRMIGEMIAEWMMNFIKNLVTSTKKASEDASSSIATIGTSAVSTCAIITAAFVAIGIAITDAFVHGYQEGEIFWKGQRMSIQEMINLWKQLGLEIENVVSKWKLAKGYGIPPKEKKVLPPREGKPPRIITPPPPKEEEEREGEKAEWQMGFEGIVRQPMRPLIGEVPEYVKVMPLSSIDRSVRGMPARVVNVGVTINAQRLDDRTIDEAAEKIFAAIRRQESRHG